MGVRHLPFGFYSLGDGWRSYFGCRDRDQKRIPVCAALAQGLTSFV
jgi:hypothetical protein